ADYYGQARGGRKTSILHQPHFMLCLDVVSALEGAMAELGLETELYLDDLLIKQLREDGQWQHGIIPDAYLDFGQVSFFIEADRGTEDGFGVAKNAFSKKIHGYLKLL